MDLFIWTLWLFLNAAVSRLTTQLWKKPRRLPWCVQWNSDTISNTYSLDCENSLIRSDGPFVAAIGLKNIIVVATKTSVLITDSEHTQDVKKVVEMLRESQQVEKL